MLDVIPPTVDDKVSRLTGDATVMLSNLSNCVGLNNPARLVSVDAVAKGIIASFPSLLVICKDISL